MIFFAISALFIGVGAWDSFCGAQGWKQVWADEFSQHSLDESSWTIDLQGGDSRVRDALGTADNVYIENGTLVLRSQRENKGGYNYTSGAVQTQGKHSWSGSTRACVSAILPGGKGGNGIWPAHWMMPDNKACWPSNGEIDIMEMINGDGVLHSTYHWTLNGSCGNPHPSASKSLFVGGDWYTAFHEYAVEYGNGYIAFALDGNVFENITAEYHADPTHPVQFFDVPYYIILNTAVGGPWPKPPDATTVFPTHHRIDYVRISQPAV